MINAIPITEKSWILYEKMERCGLMRLVDNTKYTIMGGPYAGKYDNLKELEKTLNKLTFEKMKVNKEIEKATVGDFPIKHDTAHEIKSVDNLRLYTKIEGSKDIYAAGYFSIKTNDK